MQKRQPRAHLKEAKERRKRLGGVEGGLDGRGWQVLSAVGVAEVVGEVGCDEVVVGGGRHWVWWRLVGGVGY
jgi:nucleotide-binding universal stress UspA family protein